MKVNITKVRAHVAVHLELSGSVLAQTVQAACPKVVTTYDVESPDDTARVAAVLRNARNGCWVRAAVTSPVPFEDTISLNGRPMELDDYPPGASA